MPKTNIKQWIIVFAFFVSFQICHAQNGMWTWVGGTQITGDMGNYGVKSVPNASNLPPARYQAAYWTDLAGNFWMMGGRANDLFNDMWKYDIVTKVWTWMHGPSLTVDQDGEFGIMGVSSPLNYPSARGYGVSCWTDNSGNLWLYGGIGLDRNGNTGGLSDVWKYEVSNNQWTWVSGSDTANKRPVFGIKGVPAAANTPGARLECKSNWTENSNLWLFGGEDGTEALNGIKVRNDMWKYNISTNQWTWMKGDSTFNSTGSYGAKGIEAASNLPPARITNVRWKGHDNNFYIFGGGTDSNSFNDVWKYNLQSNNWTWVSGSSLFNDSGKYSIKCDPNLIDYPHARIENSTIEFNVNDNHLLWTFGGFKKVYNVLTHNDLWLYNMDNKNWTWVSGSNASVVNPQGNYGTINVASLNNMIPGRGGSCIWKDNNNNLYFFGGIVYDSLGNLIGNKNDLWKFEPDTACFYQPLQTTSATSIDNEMKFVIYPNPSNGSFIIQTNGLLSSELEIFNVVGEKVHRAKLLHQKSEINLNVSNGIYYYQIKDANRIIGSGKLSVQR